MYRVRCKSSLANVFNLKLTSFHHCNRTQQASYRILNYRIMNNLLGIQRLMHSDHWFAMSSTQGSTSEELSIVEWYKKQTCFITGATGFMGKALLFKLLQCGVPKMYLLVRTKKGQNPEERLDTLIKHEIFDSIREKDANFRSRLVAIAGDVTEPNLAISEVDLKIIQNETTVIFHVAASVRFDDPLKQAIYYNLRSTRDLVAIAKTVKNLKMFHYVSTAYSNCEHIHDKNPKGVEEKVYKKKMNYEKLIDFVSNAPDYAINAVEKKLLGSSPNTYIFTKHLAEAVVGDASEFIPVVISRPEIVMASVKEPYPGWMDNVTSPVAIVGGVAKGILRLYLGQYETDKAYVAVDVSINAMMACTWKEVVKKEGENKVEVYNMSYLPMNADKFFTKAIEVAKVYPQHNGLWTPIFLNVDSDTVFLLGHLLLHVLPAIFLDTILRLTGNEPRLVKIYRRMYVALLALHPIVNLDDKFELRNHAKLLASIPEKELNIFYINMIDYEELEGYLITGCTGFRKFLGEPPYVSEKDRLHQKRLKILDVAVKIISISAFLWLFPFNSIGNYVASSFNNFFMD